MDNTFDYINIREVLSRLTRNKLLKDLTLEAVILYTIDFIRIIGLKQSYENKEVDIEVNEYRALLPCDLISINQVKDVKSGICLKHMTNTFNPRSIKVNMCGAKNIDYKPEFTYKTLNKVLFCGLKHCKLRLSYLATPVDEDGFPLLLNDPMWINTLELYIKQLVYSDLFDELKISIQSLNNALLQYAFRVGLLQNRYTIPNYSEMESIKSMWCQLILETTDFDNGFKDLYRREYLINH